MSCIIFLALKRQDYGENIGNVHLEDGRWGAIEGKFGGDDMG